MKNFVRFIFIARRNLTLGWGVVFIIYMSYGYFFYVYINGVRCYGV